MSLLTLLLAPGLLSLNADSPTYRIIWPWLSRIAWFAVLFGQTLSQVGTLHVIDYRRTSPNLVPSVISLIALVESSIIFVSGMAIMLGVISIVRDKAHC
jgi:hypothetical protein